MRAYFSEQLDLERAVEPLLVLGVVEFPFGEGDAQDAGEFLTVGSSSTQIRVGDVEWIGAEPLSGHAPMVPRGQRGEVTHRVSARNSSTRPSESQERVS